MTSDEWPRISCPRFDGESERDHSRRAARIAEITTGFRKGRYRGDIADRLERELVALQEPGERFALAS
jgi:hypothetical protein